MPEEEIEDANTTESSPVEDENTESSPEESGEATPQEATQEQVQEPPFHEHPRWQETLEKTRQAERRADYAEGQLAERGVKPVQPEADPYANLDAQSKLWHQENDKRTQQAIDKTVSIVRQQYESTLNAQANQIASIQEKLFHSEERDVVPGSKEEELIAQKISAGYLPEDAAWAVMGKNRVESAKSSKTVKTQQKTQEKAQANLETGGIPANSGLPTSEKPSFRDDLDKRAREMGL